MALRKLLLPWALLLMTVPRVLGDPDAIRFLAISIAVAVAVGVVGSAAALGLVAVRRLTGGDAVLRLGRLDAEN